MHRSWAKNNSLAGTVRTVASDKSDSPKLRTSLTFDDKPFGSKTNGEAFDDGTHRHICKISIWSSSPSEAKTKGIEAICIQYDSGIEFVHGSPGPCVQPLKMTLPRGEFVNEVMIQESSKAIHGMQFRTNRNRTIGQLCDQRTKSLTKGRMSLGLGKGKTIQEHSIAAPRGCMLQGVKGREGKRLQSIGFHWGSIMNAGRCA